MILETRTHEGRKVLLEEMIDHGYLCNVLDALSEVCHEKSDHLASAWGDAPAAKAWTKAAKRIESLSARTDYPFLV